MAKNKIEAISLQPTYSLGKTHNCIRVCIVLRVQGLTHPYKVNPSFGHLMKHLYDPLCISVPIPFSLYVFFVFP